MIIELDVSPKVAVAEVEAPTAVASSAGANEVIGLVIAQGPPGTPGPQGPQGPSGPTYEGIAWWYGDGPPTTIVGSKPGDFYMDLDDGTIYKLGD